MRIRITFEEFNNRNIIFPIHYNHLVQSFIYKNIKEEISNFLHDKGFIYKKRKFKMFVFSRVFSKSFKILKEKIEFDNSIYFFLSSPLKEFISQFAEGLLKKTEFKIYNNNLILKEIFVMPIPKINKITKIKMLSPVTVYSTLYKDKKKKTYYYSPFEKEFSLLLKENLIKKYEAFYKKKIEFDFKIKPLNVNKNFEKIIIYKGTVIKGWLGNYEIESDEEIIKFAYDVGIGSKNSQGFGMFEICT